MLTPLTMRRFCLIWMLLFLASSAHSSEPSRADHTDFGASPDRFFATKLEPTQTDPPTLRERLVREGIIDDIAPRTAPNRKSNRPEAVEELPAPPASPKAVPAVPKPETAPTVAPSPQPSLADRIQHRYSDPRVGRLLDEMTAQTSVNLYVEIAKMIDTRHIQPSTYARRVNAAFNRLDTALNSAAFRQTARLQGDERSIAQLQRALASLRDRATIKTLDDSVTTLTRVQDAFERYVSIHPAAVGLEFVHAELDTLDQFSMLIPPEKAGGVSVGLRDSLVGIGVEVEPHPEGLKIVKVLPGGPAAEVQMRRGDVLTAADRQPLKGLELNQAVDHILGQAGSSLDLNLVRGNRRGDVTLVRRRIELHAVASRMIDDQSKVGYIRLESFSESSVQEIDQALVSLNNQGMQSLVLDLRGNPGGLLTAAIEISDRFLPRGTIVSTKGRTPADNSREEAHYGATWKVPLVVLIDHNSASASEILAAAIQENNRGMIVGERSYGKGTVQTLFPLQSAPAGLRLTTARFYSPEGREMAGAGVTPDVKVESVIGDDADNDVAIATALKLTAQPRLKEMAVRMMRTGEILRVIRLI